jgi:nicotinamidase-related amidase
MSALILIDLQNDFLAPSAPFKVDSNSQDSLRKTLEALVPAFRRSGGHIIWVQSHYALNIPQKRLQEPEEIAPTEEPIPDIHGISSSLESSMSMQPVREGNLDWVVEGTHTGKKPCCREGTYGAELVSWSDSLRHSNDTIVTKTFFSAFKESSLEEILVQRNVKKLYFGGLLSNMCVLATSLSAIRITSQRQNWEIYVVIDALGWRRQESHRRALETMESYGVRLMGSTTFTEIQEPRELVV